MSPYRVLKKISSNTYELVISYNLGINTVFNVENWIPYCVHFDYAVVIRDLASLDFLGISTFSHSWTTTTRTADASS